MTRLEIALQLMTRPADPVLTAVDALDIADALLDWMLVQAAAAKGAK